MPLPSTWRGRVAAFGVRNLLRFAHWRGRMEARALDAPPRRGDQLFRGFVQVNFIRQH
ncbi:MAG: hypothetical protein ACJ798_01540 [Phenylobacterium sp.]